MAFAMKLRQPVPAVSGLAPAGPLRDQQSERRRALANATNVMLASAPAKNKHIFTSAGRGENTPVFATMAAGKALTVVPKAASTKEPTASQRQRRLAALSRWYKARKAAGTDVASVPPTVLTISLAPGMSEGTRLARRGEFEHIGGSYHNYTAEELLDLVLKVQNKELESD